MNSYVPEIRQEFIQNFRLCFVTGGAGSGKSEIAEKIAASTKDHVTYIATCGWSDDTEMQKKIKNHQERRPSHWEIIEEQTQLPKTINRLRSTKGLVLIDCLTVWISNLMEQKMEVKASIEEIKVSLQQAPYKIVIVSNELGMGIVPDNSYARCFRNLHGFCNAEIARLSDMCIFVVSGIPIVIKNPDL